MRICYFGDYDPNYSRTRIILAGLRETGINVIEVNDRRKGFAKYRSLWRKLRTLNGEYDVTIIGFGDARLMPVFARLIGGKNIVWEALFSQYDNWVFDRKLAKPHSFKAYLYWFLDWLGCRVSDCILLDTKLHQQYFVDTFGVPVQKLAHVYVGADTAIFHPQAWHAPTSTFEVEFHGKYFPMQGTDVIVRAAKLLENENVHFTLIGSGQELASTKALAVSLNTSNITFEPFLPQERIVEFVRNADICIGLIGGVPRVVRAIPTKLWEAAAMARVSVNASPGSLEEVFTPGVDVIGIPPGNHEQLATKIRELKMSGRAEEMGKSAYARFLSMGTPEKIGESLVQLLRDQFPKIASIK